MWKKILSSKITQYVFSIVLLIVAFLKVDIWSLGKEIISVPWWSLPLIASYFSITIFLGGWRWSILVLDKVTIRDVLVFTKSTFMGMFYGIFFPSPVGGDLIKWTTLTKIYPKISKTKLIGTVLIDRIIGVTTLCIVSLIAMIVGKSIGYTFPDYLWWTFLILNFGAFVFFVLSYVVDFEKIIGRFGKLQKIAEIAGLLRRTKLKHLFLIFLICFISEPIWMSTTWLIALVFGLKLGLLEVLIFVPIISLVLTLPISVAGFGARETMFVYFFSQLGLPTDKILAVSTFNGIVGIAVSLVGGVLTLF